MNIQLADVTPYPKLLLQCPYLRADVRLHEGGNRPLHSKSAPAMFLCVLRP